MLSEKQIYRVINKYSDRLLKDFDLQDWEIHWIATESANFHILKKLNLHVADNESLYGGSYFSTKDKAANIAIYSDTAKGQTHVLGTMIHELLHIKFDKLTCKIPKFKYVATDEEEELVCFLEDLLVELYYGQ